MDKIFIEKIIRQMKSELSEEQLSKLTTVCYEALKETEQEEYENYIELFLASKKIEGCSKRTNEYYSQVLKSFRKAYTHSVMLCNNRPNSYLPC